MTHTLRRIPAATLSVLAAAAVVTATAAPAASAPQPANRHDKDVHYVALGDSYAAGVGTNSPDPSAGECYRSALGWAPQIAAKAGWTLDYQACSGLTAPEILARQVPALSESTDVVTLTAGGNDIHFGEVIGACVVGNDTQCAAGIQLAQAATAVVLPVTLPALYAAVIARAPHAKIVVAGYPRLFGPDTCATQAGVSATERAALNAVADLVDAQIEKQARAAHLTYVDVRDAFRGHATCARVPYINSFVAQPAGTNWDSFHPNVDGQAAYARRLFPALAGDRGRCDH